MLSLAQAWALVSTNAAKAAMLSDRGEIAEGLRGDVVVIDPATRQPVATFVEGRLAWIAASGAQRIR